MHIYCPTDFALVLTPAPDAQGIWRLPRGVRTPGGKGSDGNIEALAKVLPTGVWFAPKALLPISDQIMDAVKEALAMPQVQIDLHQDYADEVSFQELQTTATLYIAHLPIIAPSPRPPIQQEHGAEAPATVEAWQTVPDALRMMPPNRNRLAFVRAWQVLMGAMKTDGVKAVEIADLLKDKH